MSAWIRDSVVAGRFYPRDAGQLADLIAECLSPGPATAKEPPYAIVAPHAGYIYSGRIAGQVYRRLPPPRTAVIVCPNHTGEGARVSVWGKGAWRTPLGEVAVDEAAAKRFLEAMPGARLDQAAHAFEHAIEVHVPFLQTVAPGAAIVPIVLGPLPIEAAAAAGEALAAVAAATEGCLLVASTDMSHYLPAAEAKRRDELALAPLERVDAAGLYRAVTANEISMCGFIPTTAVLAAAAAQGRKRATLVAYGHSGETTGDDSSVVAYASAII